MYQLPHVQVARSVLSAVRSKEWSESLVQELRQRTQPRVSRSEQGTAERMEATGPTAAIRAEGSGYHVRTVRESSGTRRWPLRSLPSARTLDEHQRAFIPFGDRSRSSDPAYSRHAVSPMQHRARVRPRRSDASTQTRGLFGKSSRTACYRIDRRPTCSSPEQGSIWSEQASTFRLATGTRSQSEDCAESHWSLVTVQRSSTRSRSQSQDQQSTHRSETV